MKELNRWILIVVLILAVLFSSTSSFFAEDNRYTINVIGGYCTVNGIKTATASSTEINEIALFPDKTQYPEGKIIGFWDKYVNDVFQYRTDSSGMWGATGGKAGDVITYKAIYVPYVSEVSIEIDLPIIGEKIPYTEAGLDSSSLFEVKAKTSVPNLNFSVWFTWENGDVNGQPYQDPYFPQNGDVFEVNERYNLIWVGNGIVDENHSVSLAGNPGLTDYGLGCDENTVFKLNGERIFFTGSNWKQVLSNIQPTLKKHNIIAKNGTVQVNGISATKASEGDTVSITANSVAGKIFDGWSSSVTLANKKSETTTFTMPAADVTVEATYKTVSEGSSEQNKDTSTTESESASGSDVMDATDSELVDGATDTGVTDTGTIDGDSDSVNTGVSENGSDVVTNSSSAETDAVSSSGQDNSDAHSGKDGSDSGSSLIPEEEDGLSVGATVAIVGGSVGVVAVVAFVFRKSILALLRAIFRG
ncbi:MAG: hypothetical protein J6M34_08190 [Clostridia bacterium]|nr:hypothetical protein [Clostridia bacterium]